MTETMTMANELSRRSSSGTVLPLYCEAWARSSEIREHIDYQRRPRWITIEFPIGIERSTSQATEVTLANWNVEFIPRTALGKKLLLLRKRAIASGIQMLSAEEVLEEVKRRRGELQNHETDLY